MPFSIFHWFAKVPVGIVCDKWKVEMAIESNHRNFFGSCSAPMHFAPRVRNVIDFVKLKISEKTNRLSIETRTWNSIIGFQLKKKWLVEYIFQILVQNQRSNLKKLKKGKLISMLFCLHTISYPSLHKNFLFPEGWIEIEFERIFKRKRNLIWI